MPANVESMFSLREKPWHGLGTIVAEAPDSSSALELAGLNWSVLQKDITTADGGKVIPGFKANVRESDDKVLALSLIATRSFRTVRLLPLQTNYWEKASVMKRRGVCRAAEESGCSPGCHSSISSTATRSRPILCS